MWYPHFISTIIRTMWTFFTLVSTTTWPKKTLYEWAVKKNTTSNVIYLGFGDIQPCISRVILPLILGRPNLMSMRHAHEYICVLWAFSFAFSVYVNLK